MSQGIGLDLQRFATVLKALLTQTHRFEDSDKAVSQEFQRFELTDKAVRQHRFKLFLSIVIAVGCLYN